MTCKTCYSGPSTCRTERGIDRRDDHEPSSQRESAKIYQFPTADPPDASEAIRGRAAQGCPAMRRAIAAATFGSGWYHEAAVHRGRARACGHWLDR